MKTQLTKIRVLLSLLMLGSAAANAQLTFTSLDSLFAFADRNSASSKISVQQSLLAKWTKVAALANTINFRNPVSFSATNNLLLPVNFIPAQVFGGPEGTFRQITLGQQYVSNFNYNPQIDIINPQNWARVQSAELNKEMTEVNNSITRNSLHESIAAAYFNCVSLNEQISTTEKSLVISDSLLMFVTNKFELGVARAQDLNNAKVNNLSVKDKLQQLKINRDQQLNALKILCDIPPNTVLNIQNISPAAITSSARPGSYLQAKYMMLQSQYMKNELRANRLSMLPVVSLVYYQGWQQNSNKALFDNNAKWIQSKYIGLRITVPFPPDVNKLSQNYTNKANYRIASLNAAHQQLQNELSNHGLSLDLEKANTSFEIAEQIAELKTDSYQKSQNQYKEGILPADNLFTAFTDLLNARLSLAAARASLDYSRAKISINNSFK